MPRRTPARDSKGRFLKKHHAAHKKHTKKRATKRRR